MKSHVNAIFELYSSVSFFTAENKKKSYLNFQNDIQQKAQEYLRDFSLQQKVVVKNPDQYLFLVEIFALWSVQKSPILISPKATPYYEETLLDQISDNAHTEISDEFLILFTSGSTDLPKGVSLSFSNLIFQINAFSSFFKTIPQEIYFLNLPLNHVGGLMLCLRAFFNGGTITTIENDPISYISLVPHQLQTWMDSPVKLNILKKTKATLIGGTFLPATIKEMALNQMLPIYETYGMSETASFIAINGQLLPQIELKLNDEKVILLKGPMLALGYYVKKEFQKISDWFETNDIASLDSQNFISIIGRKNHQLVSGGENISPQEIENIVLSHPEINKAFVCGIPDEKWGDLITLLYESKSGETIELEPLLKERLHPYSLPKFIFNTSFKNESTLKISQKDIKVRAYELFLKTIFTHSYFFSSATKPTIVILHGFMETKDDWEFWSKQVFENYNILTINLPGHGKTCITHFSSLDEILSRLSDFILLFSPNPILLGYSMGGRIALQLTKNFIKPEKLILISSSLGLTTKKEQDERFKQDISLFDNISNKDELKIFFNKWYSNSIFGSYLNTLNFDNEIEKKVSIKDIKSLIGQWKASLNYFSQGRFPLRDLDHQHLPIFYLSGSLDSKYSKSTIKDHYVIIGSGHNPHKTHPEELEKQLLKLL